jgi:uncharacterized protein YcbK (DUF882 family)
MTDKLSKNFSRSEFECPCGCGMDTVDAELIIMLQYVRDKYGPVIITSANRCDTYNESVGGADDSQHKKSRAADFTTPMADLSQVAEDCDQAFPNSGLGVYNSFIHIDSRNAKARWRG